MMKLTTEQRNERSERLDRLSTVEIITLMNEEDQKVPLAVKEALPQIEPAIEAIVERLAAGGRLFYIGAGTSGRLGILDAAECPPTFGTKKEQVTAIIAGGSQAIFEAVEDAEDNAEAGRDEVRKQVSSSDVLFGIAASGKTPYVLGAVAEAKRLGIRTVGLACNQHTLLGASVDYPIEVNVGPEIVTGSTRLKAATAQKLVLNMISTATMIRLGKVYKNLMVNVQATNDKLRKRVIDIIQEAAQVDEETARRSCDLANGDARAAILMLEFQTDYAAVMEAMEAAGGHFGRARGQLLLHQ
ncbi:N-acetylmuramic acid 6-phosphate etherase 2 [Paenibacillus marchantiophytorum]|uniref:N-acetylmuramic acid 6-phosphate etherase n=1 Tax=Paenibacillus marchantiophytorum TaxID=1619310 RepID=A0ABQ1FHM9_9BACL|nr:N-acetylmuramic acid 6-phosphate etherase [Paenibacillus marchantiophytorum]GGA13870.1 N-acetylmuramic acid 6-phosphate etherase 2 [Paenibacillus marchantiophytorum]